MTETLTLSVEVEGPFASGSLKRSSSQTSLLISPHPYARSNNVRSAGYAQNYDIRLPASLPSSAPSSPRVHCPDFSNQPSYVSTPSSSVSLNEDCLLDEHELHFPSYDDHPPRDLDPPPSPSDPSPAFGSIATTHLPPAPAPAPAPAHARTLSTSAGDDTAVCIEPSRHVDYLSHEWKEEDIWSSWRHVVSKKAEYENSHRLENAAWRTWGKRMGNIKTLSPEKLNWMKDHDVTWLYGPLLTGDRYGLASGRRLPATAGLSRTDSFTTKKPILKKRSPSEIMLQKSLSSSTLMKQAVAALRAQQPILRGAHRRPTLGTRTYSEDSAPSVRYTPCFQTFSSTPSTFASSSSSGIVTPCEKRHIHFNDKVEQCIAINQSADHEDDHDDDHDDDDHHDHDGNPVDRADDADDADESSDDGIMMQTIRNKERKLGRRASTPRGSFGSEGKTIAMLPSTTLKYRSDTPEPAEEPKARGGFWGVASRLIQSPSQETLRPSDSSSNFLLEPDDDEDPAWQARPGRTDGYRRSGHRLTTEYRREEDSEMEERGMRRTPSGMFMPYESDEDDIMAAGLFGKVVDTVNTAKDIAHVIWNVGWRK